jgi:putative transposase
MSRPFISHPAGVALHVVRRGRGHARCFFGERDRLAFLGWLGKYAARFGCAVHAYVLMGNHVHLLLTASDRGGTSRLISKLCDRHAQLVSETQACPGPLWEEGFEASPIHVRRHFLACMRYIELNPVRARLVTRPGAYRWSSHPANALGRENALITPHPFYYALGRNDGERQRAYQRLFAANAMSRAQTPGGPRTGPRGPSRPT